MKIYKKKEICIAFIQITQNFAKIFILDSLCMNLGVKFDILMIVLGFVHLTKVVVSYLFSFYCAKYRDLSKTTLVGGQNSKIPIFVHQIIILDLQPKPNSVRDPQAKAVKNLYLPKN